MKRSSELNVISFTVAVNHDGDCQRFKFNFINFHLPSPASKVRFNCFHLNWCFLKILRMSITFQSRTRFDLILWPDLPFNRLIWTNFKVIKFKLHSSLRWWIAKRLAVLQCPAYLREPRTLVDSDVEPDLNPQHPSLITGVNSFVVLVISQKKSFKNFYTRRNLWLWRWSDKTVNRILRV